MGSRWRTRRCGKQARGIAFGTVRLRWDEDVADKRYPVAEWTYGREELAEQLPLLRRPGFHFLNLNYGVWRGPETVPFSCWRDWDEVRATCSGSWGSSRLNEFWASCGNLLSGGGVYRYVPAHFAVRTVRLS